jgi:hypothetical protein
MGSFFFFWHVFSLGHVYILFAPAKKNFWLRQKMSSLVLSSPSNLNVWEKPSSQLQVARYENFVLYENPSENFAFFLYVLFKLEKL